MTSWGMNNEKNESHADSIHSTPGTLVGMREVDASLEVVGSAQMETQWTPDTRSVGGDEGGSATLEDGKAKVEGFRRGGEVTR